MGIPISKASLIKIILDLFKMSQFFKYVFYNIAINIFIDL